MKLGFCYGRGRLRSSLLLRFGVVSIILTATLGVVLSVWLTNFIRSTAIDQARATAAYSVAVTVNAMGVHTGQQPLVSPAQLALATRLMQATVASGKYVAASSWMAGDVVVYGVEPGRVGKRERVRPQVNAALGGKQDFAIVTHPQTGLGDPSERAALTRYGPLLETFTPVRIDNKVFAATVLYQPWIPVQRVIDRETRNVLLLVAAGIVVLWLGLMRLVLSASRALRTRAADNLRLASHDPLTDLPNRKLLGERVREALAVSGRSGRLVALLLLDINRFKEVNDTLGHRWGDLLLQQIGSRLAGALRPGDFVARLGGDEFVVVLSALDDPLDAATTARRLTGAVAEPFLLNTVSLSIEASIGIAISPDHGADFDELLHHADLAMYAAKSRGVDSATYPARHERTQQRKFALTGPARSTLNDSPRLALDLRRKVDSPGQSPLPSVR